MKFWALALLASTPLHAATLTLEVTDILSDVGTMGFAVYDNEDTWLGDDVVASQTVVVKEVMTDGTLVVTFELEPGDYAVSVHHDDNANGKMDTNFIGIPKEPTGLSNGAVPKFGPPKYKDAVFPLGEDGVNMTIKLLD